MTKKEIVKAISEETGLTQLQTKQAVQKTFDAIVEALVNEPRIELRNFGVFEVKKRAARKARNPRTGETVDVPEKYVVTFKPGKKMEEKVQRLRAARDRQNAAQEAARKETAAGDGQSSDTAFAPMATGTSQLGAGGPRPAADGKHPAASGDPTPRNATTDTGQQNT